ncbi:spore germination protein [Clostridium sp. WILCCON 0269]|uniref:Spore germination protein n=1 Tax=Candidatus Clostridium eludens TaxID=3381663 RepID=A0ABW8SIL0_9CLOT
MNENNNAFQEKLTENYEENLLKVERILTDCPDIVRTKVSLHAGKKGCFFYVQGLVDINLIQRDFINPIINLKDLNSNEVKSIQNIIPVGGISYPININDIVNEIVLGNTVFIGEGLKFSISCALKKFDKRNIIEPTTEKNVRGSHDGLVEDINTNIAILRMRMKNPNLKFKIFKVGTSTNQTLAIAYLQNIANDVLLNTLCKKISTIDYDGLIDSGFIEQMITDHPYSLFPQYNATERPDRITASLLEGKFAIILESTPVVLITPVNFYSFIQAPDDYNINWLAGSFLRLLRMVCLVLAIFLPSTYIAVISYNYYVMPIGFLVNVAEARSRVPFPPIVEALFMELFIEMLREATIRLPTYISTTVGVVGGLIIGQSAVQAGVVSNQMVIVVAVTAIATFTIPMYDMGIALRITRFLVMIAAAVFGMVGIVISVLLLIAHLIVLESLGQPYLQPIEPLKLREIKDANIRAQIKHLKRRPDVAKPKDKWRGTGNEEAE